MLRIRKLLIIALILGGGWQFFQRFKIEGLEHLSVKTRDPSAIGSSIFSSSTPVPARSSNAVRVASFNIQVFGESKLAKPEVVNSLVQVIRRFDVIAIQEIRATSQTVLPQFLAQINADGSHYDYVIGPRLGRTSSKEQYAFIYDAASIELDRESVYTVNDPQDLLHREPLVASFRVRGPPAEQAFTFTLINIHTDPDETDRELNALDDVIREVRNDGRGEDDVILLGDLNVDDYHFGQLGQMPYIAWAISGVASNMHGDKLYDNILFDSRATTEFTGLAGVFDLPGELRLNMNQALEVSDHRPIWIEFSSFEGGLPGRVARQPTETGKK